MQPQSDTNANQDGYLALPQSGKGPGVLVLHAWWGLNDTIKNVCDRLAGEGFVAYAPDLYHGKIATTIEQAETLSKELDANSAAARADVASATEQLWGRIKSKDYGLGVIGFSLGAYYALQLSVQDPERIRTVVIFYGTGGGDYSPSKAAYLGHFAENDPFESAEWVDALEAEFKSLERPVTFYRYEGVGHWFFEPDRSDAYNEAAAQLAWDRTIAFLKERLSP